MIQAIIFDCFGVLTEDAWIAFCGALAPDAAKRAHELSHQRNKGFLSDSEFLEQVAEATGKSVEVVRTTQASLSGSSLKNGPLVEYIHELRSAGYQIGIMSNIGSDWITSELLNPTEQELFSHMILSYELGVTKPDPRIYQIAIDRFGLLPEEIVFIDDQTLYIEAAKEQGMQGIVYTNLQALKTELTTLLDTNK